MYNKLKITLELEDDLCAMEIEKNEAVVKYADLNREDQIKVLNCLGQNYTILSRYLKK